MNWQPQETGLFQLLTLIQDSMNPELQQKIHQQLQSFNQFPDFNNYLVFIFAKMKDQPEHIRTVAGIVLKNNLRDLYPQMTEQTKYYIKCEILSCIGDSMISVRRTLASIIVTLIVKGGLKNWPNLLQTLVSCLDSNDDNVVDGAFRILLLICEDYGHKLDSEENGRPLTFLIPKFLQFFKHSNENFRYYAISCINEFIIDAPPALLVNMDLFIQGLFFLAHDNSSEVKRKICEAFYSLTELRSDHIKRYIKDIIQFMLHTSNDPNEAVAMEACEFWSVIAEVPYCVEVLSEFLPSIFPLLLNRMIYSDTEIALNEGEDESIPDQPTDIKPFIHSSKSQKIQDEEEEEEEEEEEDDEEEVSNWTLRKCAAAGLDILSTTFHETILDIILPLIAERLKHEDWKIRESAILALGAIAEGCSNGMKQHLPQLIPVLINFLSDQKPLIRSISCWTLSRYASWIVKFSPKEFLEPLLLGILNRLLDKNKKVQESACTALANIEDIAQTLLLPYLKDILSYLMTAFQKYQAKNLLLIYDTIGTLADNLSQTLNQPDIIPILMNPLIAKWNSLPDNNLNLLPLLECLTSIAMALGPSFQPYAFPIFHRCLKLIEMSLIHQAIAQDSNQNNQKTEIFEREFIVCSLDLISGLAEGLATGFESLVSNSNLGSLLFECLKDRRTDIRQSSFALVGDLAKSCMIHLKHLLPNYLPILMEYLRGEFQISVCNNAVWAIGEISLRCREEEMRQYAPTILQSLIALINKRNLNRNILENTAITIGRLGLCCPILVSSQLVNFIQSWCMTLRTIHDDEEKESAFKGLCKLIAHNPSAVVNHFVFVCDAFTSWEQPSPELKQQMTQILHAFKNSMENQMWVTYFTNFPPILKEKLKAFSLP